MAPDAAAPSGAPSATAPGPGRSRRRWALLALLAAILVTRLVAIYTESINWDEFALLNRAARTAETGRLNSGGRPGLATALLLPFVADCEDEIAAVRGARLLWLGLTGAYLAGFAGLLLHLGRGSPTRRADAALGVALLAAVPAFLDWSIQVRSDQLALAGGAWGAVALLASRRRAPLAALSGLLFGLGYLASQKLLYVGALAALLAAGEHLRHRELRPGREALRAALCLGAMGAVLLGFRLALAQAAHGPSTTTLSEGLSAFDFYRRTIGTSQYRAMLPTLVPHGLALLALAGCSWAALARRISRRPALFVAWAVLALGAGVAFFHAAAFFYFWMTLGLFPAAAFTLALPSIRELLARVCAPAERAALVGLWVMLALPAVLQTALLLRDTQAVQRRSFAFVHRSFDKTDSGFHPESGLFCQRDGAPFPTLFSRSLYLLFAGEDRERNAAQLIEGFRARPVKFILESWRLNQFPDSVRQFWIDHYQPYRASVSIPGRRLSGERQQRVAFDLIVPGDYRWIPLEGAPAIAVDGVFLKPGGTLRLEAGTHAATLLDPVRLGLLVLAVNEDYRPSRTAFYRRYDP